MMQIENVITSEKVDILADMPIMKPNHIQNNKFDITIFDHKRKEKIIIETEITSIKKRTKSKLQTYERIIGVLKKLNRSMFIRLK